MDEKHKLITAHELVERSKARGVDFGNGSVTNRLRYYTKTGLIPHATRKQADDGNAFTQGHYPAYTVDLLVKIQELKKQGTPINEIQKIMTEEQLKYSTQQASAALGKEVTLADKNPTYDFNLLGKERSVSPTTVFAITFFAFVAFYSYLFFSHTAPGQKFAGSLFVKKTAYIATHPTPNYAGINGDYYVLGDEDETTSQSLASVTYYFPSSDNLLYNPSYEKGLGADGTDAFGNQKFGQPWKWDYSGSGHAGNVYVSDGSVRSGGLSLKFWDSGLDNNTTGAFETLGIQQPISTTINGRNYNLTAFVRTQSITESPTLRIGLRKSGSSDVYKDFPLTASGTSYANWRQVSHTFTNAELGMFPFIEVLNYGGGVIYIDDASSIEVTKTTSIAGGTNESTGSLAAGSISTSLLGISGAYTLPATNTLLGGGSIEVDIYGNIRPTDNGVGNLGGADNRFGYAYFKTLDVTESINIDGSVSVDRVGSSLNPANDNEYDLGSASNQWRDLYIGGTGYINGIVVGDGGLVDLSAITHDDAAPQGLLLPQNTVLTAPSSGEGYIAWDTDANTLQVFDGSTWSEVTGGGGGGGTIDGAGIANYVAYWSDSNTLTNEQYLATSRGGTGISTSSSTGVPSISTGTWSVASTLSMALGGTGAALGDPGFDRIMFWDDGAGANTWLAPDGTSVEISGTTLRHVDTSTQASSDNTGVTVIQDITLDTYGHLSGLATVDLSSSFDNYSSWTLAGDSGSSAISSAGTATIAGGTNLTSAESTGTVTINLDDNVSLSGTTGLTLTGAASGVIFENAESISNAVDGTLTLTAPTTSITGDLTVSGGDLYITPQSTSASTTEGTLYYDSDDDNIYVYANGGWVDLTVQGGGSAAWSAITNPGANLSLSMAEYTTTLGWDSTGNANLFSLNYDNNGGSAGTDQLMVLTNALSDQTTGDLNTEALLVLDQADTTASGTTILDDALLILNSGGSTLTDAIQIGTGSQAIGTAINIGSTGVTTDISLQNGETIDNNSDGVITLTSPSTSLSGDLTVSGGELYLTPIASSGSTTEGTLYYDSDDDKLYVYANGGFVDLTVQGGAGYWAQNSGVLSPVTITDDLAIGGIDSSADFFVADNGKLTFNVSTTGTYTDYVLETEWTTGDLINADWASGTTQTGAISGLNLDFTNLTTDGTNALYGIHINDQVGATGSTEYGLYVQGSNWDYGIYSDDDIYSGGNATVAGTTGLTLSGTGGQLAFAFGETIDNDADGVVAVTSPSTTFSGDITVTGGDVLGANGEAIDIGEAANGSITLSESGGQTLTFDLDATKPTIGTSTDTLAMTSAFDFDDNSATAFTIGDGTNNYFTFDGSTDAADTLFAINSTSSGITTGNIFTITDAAITTGEVFGISSTSTALASGGHLALLEWNPGSADSTDADLVTINVNGNATVSGDLFNVQNNGSDLFSVSQTSITSSIPHSFTAAGDVSIAYDIIMTNQTSSNIKSYGPFTLEAGESFENNDLTLKTSGTGNVVLDLSGTGSLQPVGTDPSIILDVTTATDTDFWLGVQDDAGGDDDDVFAIGDGTTPGTNTFLSIGTTGLTTLTGLAGSNTLTLTAGDAVLSDGSLTLTDADNAATFSSINNTATTIGVGAVGGVNVLSSTSLTTGDLLELQLTEGTLNGGYYLNAWDVTGSSSVFNIGEDGVTTIAGTAGSNSLNLTAGDAVLSDGSLAITDADNATSLSVANNTASTIGAGVAGGLNVLSSTSLTTGDLLELQLTEGTLNGGYYLNAWDVTGSSSVFNIGEDGNTNIAGSLNVTGVSTFDSQVSLGSEIAFGATDTTPTVAGGSYFVTDGTAQTLTDFDNGVDGMILIIESTDATVFDCATAGPLLCGDDAEDITTADNDTTMWINNGGDAGVWHLLSHVSATTQQTGADLAEWYVSTEELSAGDVVSIDPSEEVRVNKSTTAYDNKVMGIVSTQPGITLGEIEENAYQVALAGRVPVKVSDSSETIQAGDYLTTSSDSGKAMKATHAGLMIGKALESWTPGSGKETVETFINLTWYDPDPVRSFESSNGTPLLALGGNGEVLGANDSSTEAVLSEMQLAVEQSATNISLLESSLASLEANSQSLAASISEVGDRVDNLETRIETLELLGGLTNEDGTEVTSGPLTDLTVLGESVLGDTLVNGSLNVGLLTVDSDEDSASIDAIGTLKLQSLALGNVEVMGGLVEIDTEGNVSVKGNVEIEGDLAVQGTVKGSSDSRAIDVEIDPEAESIEVSFENSRESAEYAVTVTPNWDTRTWVETKSEDGFTINFSSPAPDGAKMDWIIIE